MASSRLASGTDYAEENNKLFVEKLRLEELLATSVSRVDRRRLERQLDAVLTQIYELNSRLVFNCVKRFESSNRQTASHDDYVAAGFLGLTRAINTFSPGKGVLSSWAHRQIMRELLRAVRDSDHPTLSQADFEIRKKVLLAQVELRKDLDHEPTAIEIAKKAGATKRQVVQILTPPQVSSLSAPVSEDGMQTLEDTLELPISATTAVVDVRLLFSQLQELIASVLTKDELDVALQRFGLDGVPVRKLAAVGTHIGKSREVARQIELRALEKLSHPAVLSKLSLIQDH